MQHNKRPLLKNKLLGILASAGLGLVGLVNESNAGPMAVWNRPGNIGDTSMILSWSTSGSTGFDASDVDWGNMTPGAFGSVSTSPYGTPLDRDNRNDNYAGGYTMDLFLVNNGGGATSGDTVQFVWDGTGPVGVSDYNYTVNIYGTGNPSSPYYTESGSVNDLINNNGGYTYGSWSTAGISDGMVYGNVTLYAVPEPSTIGLAVTGAAALAALRRRKDKKEDKTKKA